MSLLVADTLVETAVRAGVERVYGVIGDSLNPIGDAIRRNGKLRWIHVRNEEVGAFAAGAEAQLTGRVTMCAGSAGPGHLHLVNGLYDANRSRAPMFALASVIVSPEIGGSYFQESDPHSVFGGCSVYNESCSTRAQAPRVFEMAFQHAIAREGVAVVELSGDTAEEDTGLRSLLPHRFELEPAVVSPTDRDLDTVAELIDRHAKVTIYCGAGVRHAHPEVLELAQRIKAPVGYTLRGKEWIEHDNPYAVGLTGLIGFGGCSKALQDADLLLLVGTDFPYRNFIPEGKTIIQIDSRPEHLGRRARLDYGVAGDAAPTLRGLSTRVAEKSDDSHLRAAQKVHEEALRKLDVYVRHTGGQSPVHPEFVAATLDRLASEDAIFIPDTGMSAVWACRYLNMTAGRRLIGSFNHGSMANAMPQAIGAQLAYPDRQVVALCGDGGLTMLLGDLSTIATYELPIKLIVFDNGLLDMVHWEMLSEGFEPYETDLHNPDFAKLADAYGFLGIGVDRHDDVPAALTSALEHTGPALISIKTAGLAAGMPQYPTWEQAKGIARSTAKLVWHGHAEEVVDLAKESIRDVAELPGVPAGRGSA
ncbi:MAG: thiamine pyrophosphate-dependent enzyme [Solirubrobacteraceae bacterium]